MCKSFLRLQVSTDTIEVNLIPGNDNFLYPCVNSRLACLISISSIAKSSKIKTNKQQENKTHTDQDTRVGNGTTHDKLRPVIFIYWMTFNLNPEPNYLQFTGEREAGQKWLLKCPGSVMGRPRSRPPPPLGAAKAVRGGRPRTQRAASEDSPVGRRPLAHGSSRATWGFEQLKQVPSSKDRTLAATRVVSPWRLVRVLQGHDGEERRRRISLPATAAPLAASRRGGGDRRLPGPSPCLSRPTATGRVPPGEG